MKTKFLITVTAIMMAMSFGAYAQVPEKLNYQGIARDNNGDALANQTLGVKISILHNSTVDYSETHSVTTNGFGLYTLVIGDGTPIFGGMASVDWSSGNKFVKVEIDPNGGTNYTDLGTTELLSVPYALYAAESPSAGGPPTGAAGGDLTGNYPDPNITNNAVTTGKIAANAVESSDIKDGEVNTVDLANSAVTAPKIDAMGATNGQVLKYDGTNWAPAADDSGASYTAGTGIAISGTNEITADLGIDISTAEIQNDAVTSAKITDGSIATADLANNAVTASKMDAMGAANGEVLKWNGTAWAPATDIQGTTGTTYTAGTGIAISGTNEITADLGTDIATAEIQNNAVTSGKIDNATIATADLANNSVTGAKIAGMGATNGQVLKFDGTDWAPATDDPGAAGWELGGNAATATDFIGTTNNEALQFKVFNIEAGYMKAGSNGSMALGVGSLSINSTGSSNSAFGSGALDDNTTGHSSSAFGRFALEQNTTGVSNSAFGSSALRKNIDGSSNSAFGYYTLSENTTGNYNSAFGNEALKNNTTGNSNTASGYQALLSNTTGTRNTAIGLKAMNLNTTGRDNIANGYEALKKNTTGEYNSATGSWALRDNTTGSSNTANGFATLLVNTTGNFNTATGRSALDANTTGDYNTANGYRALDDNTTGNRNTAFGAGALQSNTTISGNAAFGYHALNSNSTGGENSAFGEEALALNTSGSGNSVFGHQAMKDNTSGIFNSAFGESSLGDNSTGEGNSGFGIETLLHNTIGDDNSAFGKYALSANTTGSFNTASGALSLYSNTTGDYNTAMGEFALSSNTLGSGNTAIGNNAMATYSSTVTTLNNTAVGTDTEVTDSYSYNTVLGALATSTQPNQIVIGDPFISQIGGYEPWTNLSDIRFKKDVEPISHGLDFILKLEPITYHINAEKLSRFINGIRENKIEETPEMIERIQKKSSTLESGFSAQQVEATAKEIGYDFSGVNPPANENDHYTLEYSAFVVPLVKAVQEQQQMIQDQKETIKALQQTNKEILKRLEALERE